MHRGKFLMSGLSLVILALLLSGARLAAGPAQAQAGGYTAAAPSVILAPNDSAVQKKG